ncbi:methyltransferase domain-containing protein [Streptococcus salivarius]|uniref:methyltransferase domain-containing protein n=1 Tax=Streptococcus salivarius TaxID=1304 RepID=UPI000225100C|nr:methyltransferase domain-containing protein [Streptococcus salivarius]EGX29353.1 type 11 methyltransferase [Streptococcus salivarius M18]MBZ5847349.1 class I SAM-dependent methyltransferase [Streptococcus salivarius]
MNEKLDLVEIEKFYNEHEAIWYDNWYRYTNKSIELFLKNNCSFNNDDIILNAGSGGNTYGLSGHTIHMDIAEKTLSRISDKIIGNIENIPMRDNYFDHIVCVGSVINYCDANKVISEFERVLKVKGTLYLEFEPSNSFEYFGSNKYKKSVSIIETDYLKTRHRNWIFSIKYIENLLKSQGFQINKKQQFHIISSIILKITNNYDFAAKFTRLDKIFKFFPGIRNCSSNIILKCTKIH